MRDASARAPESRRLHATKLSDRTVVAGGGEGDGEAEYDAELESARIAFEAHVAPLRGDENDCGDTECDFCVHCREAPVEAFREELIVYVGQRIGVGGVLIANDPKLMMYTQQGTPYYLAPEQCAAEPWQQVLSPCRGG